jgi:hypothetical protein
MFDVYNSKFGGHALRNTPAVISFGTSATMHFHRFFNCDFGGVASPFIDNSTSTLEDQLSGGNYLHQLLLQDCNDSNATFANADYLLGTKGPKTFWAKHRNNGVANAHSKEFPGFGKLSYDTTTSRTASPSEKAEPYFAATATFPFTTSEKYVSVNSGSTITISTYVMKNAAYTGTAPRLVLKQNSALGVDDDTALSTHSAAADTWQQLTGVTPVATEDGVFTFVIECDGGAGAIWTDDWSAS